MTHKFDDKLITLDLMTSKSLITQTETVLSELFSALNTCGQPYCVWGGYRNLPKGITGSDIDVVVQEISSDFINLLKNKGFVVSKRSVYGGHPIVFVRYLEQDMRWIPLHIITPVMPGGHRVVPDDFFHYSKTINNVKIAGTELETTILLAHGISKYKSTDKRLSRINNNLSEKGFDTQLFHFLLDKLIGNSSEIINIILKGDSASLFKDKSLLIKLAERLRTYGNNEVFSRKAKRKIRCYFHNKWTRILRATKYRGKIIAITGIDGSGKSTFIDKYSVKTKHNPCLFKAMSMSTKFLPYIVSQPIRQIIRTFTSKTETNSLWKYPTAALHIIQIFCDYIALFYMYLHARYFTALGINIAFDRYAIDHINKRLHSRKVIAFLSELTFIRCFPKPDIMIFFDITPEKTMGRKQEDTYETLKAKYESYNHLFKRHNVAKSFIRIDASKHVEEVHNQIISLCWKLLVEI